MNNQPPIIIEIKAATIALVFIMIMFATLLALPVLTHRLLNSTNKNDARTTSPSTP